MAAKAQRIELTEEFIGLWRQEKSLWDAASPLYRNKDAKERSLFKLGQHFSMSEQDVKRKINILRTYFTKELQKSLTKGTAEGEGHQNSKWPHFQSMMFLRNTISQRKTTSPSMVVNDNNEEDEAECPIIESFEAEEFQYDLPDNSMRIEEEPNRRSTLHYFANDKKRKKDNGSKSSVAINEAMSILAARSSKVANADEIFGQHVAASLRNIKDNRCKEFVKVKIQQIIFEAQFGMQLMPFQQINIAPSGVVHHDVSRHPYQREIQTQFPVPGTASSPVGTNDTSTDPKESISCIP